MADVVASPSVHDPVRALPVLLINLDGSVERLRKATQQLEAAGVSFQRLPAVDGRLLPESERNRLAPWDRRAFFKPLSPGEIGCYLSHLAALERIVTEGWPRALVLEDDFLLGPDFAAQLLDLLASGRPVPDIIKLEGVRAGGECLARLSSGVRIISNRRPPSRTIAQLWSIEGARKFLAASRVLRRPVDVQLKHSWEGDMDVLYLDPALVTDGDSTGKGSTIGARPASGALGRLRKVRYKLSFAFRCHWEYFRRQGLLAWWRAGLR